MNTPDTRTAAPAPAPAIPEPTAEDEYLDPCAWYEDLARHHHHDIHGGSQLRAGIMGLIRLLAAARRENEALRRERDEAVKKLEQIKSGLEHHHSNLNDGWLNAAAYWWSPGANTRESTVQAVVDFLAAQDRLHAENEALLRDMAELEALTEKRT